MNFDPMDSSKKELYDLLASFQLPVRMNLLKLIYSFIRERFRLRKKRDDWRTKKALMKIILPYSREVTSMAANPLSPLGWALKHYQEIWKNCSLVEFGVVLYKSWP